MSKNKLVSVVIATKNEEDNLSDCLQSIRKQSYKQFEIIVVDNNSKDRTKEIARQFTKIVINAGPERSTQRNIGLKTARGAYILFLDADMTIEKDVIKECVDVMSNQKIGGVIIPEESFGKGFWADCKRLERSFYLGVEWIEGARFFDKKVLVDVGGFDTSLISGEDWDLSQRVRKKSKLGRINKFIFHNEGSLTLKETVGKKYYYAKNIAPYLNKKIEKDHIHNQTSIMKRYRLYFSDTKQLFNNPFLGVGMLFMKTCEFSGGALGLAFRTGK